jgi:cytochrome P450
MQVLLRESIEDCINYHSSLDRLTHSKMIFHLLLGSKAKKEPQDTKILQESFFEECQSLIFGGGDLTANAMMMAFFHITRQPDILERLKVVLKEAWLKLNAEPTSRDLGKLPYLV